MHALPRASTLVLLAIFLALTGAGWALWPRAPKLRVLPQTLAADEQEIVWLYPATDTAAWERFVTAVKFATGVAVDEEAAASFSIDDQAFPEQSTVTPAIVLSVPGHVGKLSLRWYKLTSDQDTAYWVQALLERPRPPLAIVGGNTSSAAIELAQSLQQETNRLGLGDRSPFLLLTSATVEEVSAVHGADVALTSIYPGRTFRFCFTNGQMSLAVTDFLRRKGDLWPDMDPVYLVHWGDDPYSSDLGKRFLDALRWPALAGVASDWAISAGTAAGSGPLMNLAQIQAGQFRLDTPSSWELPYSIGAFDRPNRLEVAEASRLMHKKLELFPSQQQPLLILPGASHAARRFLVALRRASGDEAKRFVIATGDGIPFNTVYRDRNVAWPIQDLPFRLAFFCHRNPVDVEAGFPLEKLSSLHDSRELRGRLAGTEDLLLYADLVDACVHAWQSALLKTEEATGALFIAEFQHELRATRWRHDLDRISSIGQYAPFFDERGNRQSGTGEHVVYLRPVQRGKEQLPEAVLEVWAWQADAADGTRAWRRRAALPVFYHGSLDQEAGF
jgi:hypothetical protein